ncbi:hypothetical protein OG407_20955 [Streptomyces sp. NBC_01515]|uniref:hypothetical protein n=1 Tax=Streptomyces sp. NBC_01515 TaxID=2903890 RepID=UPI0038653F91
MDATEIDPELKDWVLEFIQREGNATRDDITRNFFPGDISRPYLYLDRLTLEGRLYTRIPPTSAMLWLPVKSVDNPVPWSDRKHAARVTHAYCAHPLTSMDSKRCLAAIGKAKLLRFVTAERAKRAANDPIHTVQDQSQP